MSRLFVTAVGPGTSVQDGGRFGAQRYGLTPSGAVDRLALAAANHLVGNAPFAAAIEIGPLNAAFTARGGAVRVALTGATRPADIAGRTVPLNQSVTLADGESLSLGVARGGVFGYLAIEGGVQGEPMFGSLAVNARAGLGSPYPRPLQSGDELQASPASGAGERRIDLPAPRDGPIRVVMGPQDDGSVTPKRCFSIASGGFRYQRPHGLPARRTGHQTYARPQYRLRRHRDRHQVPGGQPMCWDAGSRHQRRLSKVAAVISADLGRFGQTQAGRSAASRPLRWRGAPSTGMVALLRSLSDRVHDASQSLLDIGARERQCRRCAVNASTRERAIQLPADAQNQDPSRSG